MEKKRSIHWAWIILATCFVNLFINYAIRLGYNLIFPEMIRTLGFSRTAGGTIFNAYLFTYVTLTRSEQEREAVRELEKFCGRVIAVRRPNTRSLFHRSFPSLARRQIIAPSVLRV